jgi:hypothetical protein
MACGIAIALFAPDRRIDAQRPAVSPLDVHVVATVDRLYPGFTEVLESNDSAHHANLARILSANPSAESLSVLLWMLQYCPSWSSDEVPTVLQIGNVARAVGRLPLAPLARALRNHDADQRITAAVILSDNINLIPESEKGGAEGLISALADQCSRP